MMMLMPLSANALVTRVVTPMRCFMPSPTTITSARLYSKPMLSTRSSLETRSMMRLFLPSSRNCVRTMMEMSSIPEGMCSNGTNSSSSICSTFRPKPISRFIMYLLMLMEQKPLSPAMPESGMSKPWERSGAMRVPGASGLFVLRMFTGMPRWKTGSSVSSCRTENPAYESSRISRYVSSAMGAGFLMMRGLATNTESTSVKFS